MMEMLLEHGGGGWSKGGNRNKHTKNRGVSERREQVLSERVRNTWTWRVGGRESEVWGEDRAAESYQFLKRATLSPEEACRRRCERGGRERRRR